MDIDTEAPRVKVSDALDGFILGVGRIICWVNAILMVTIIVQVVLRYVFGWGLVMLEELEWHLYAVGFLIGISYATITDAHVRVDLLYVRFSKRKREWIELFGLVFIWLPFVILVFLHSFDFVADSWNHNERSVSPMGLPCRWIIKSFVPIGFALCALASVSRAIRAIYYLRKDDNGTN